MREEGRLRARAKVKNAGMQVEGQGKVRVKKEVGSDKGTKDIPEQQQLV